MFQFHYILKHLQICKKETVLKESSVYEKRAILYFLLQLCIIFPYLQKVTILLINFLKLGS